MGPTLSPVLPTSLAASAQAPGPLVPSTGLPTRTMTALFLGSPLGPSFPPASLALGSSSTIPNLPTPYSMPISCFVPIPSSHQCSKGTVGVGERVGEANLGSRRGKRDSNVLYFGFLDQTQEKLTYPSSSCPPRGKSRNGLHMMTVC